MISYERQDPEGKHTTLIELHIYLSTLSVCVTWTVGSQVRLFLEGFIVCDLVQNTLLSFSFYCEI